jgi:anti-sigma factor ChrR (cupin superfamily)
MLVNPDFSKRAIVTPDQYRWVASPRVGVERVMLDRLGGERARATSIVRYASGSKFPRHTHPGGEEVLVLSGTFSEEGRDYPSGWYLRSPPGSSHRPSSDDGATIFVKLRQMPSSETRFVRIDTRDPSHWTAREGRSICPLFADDTEQVTIERLANRERLFERPVERAELLVLEGELHEGEQRYVTGTWIRLPAGEYPELVSGACGATFYLKTFLLPADRTSDAR